MRGGISIVISPEAFGWAALAASVVSVVTYAWSTARGRTKPERASWLIWAMEYAVLLGAQYARGARDSLWLLFPQVAGILVISALSWRPSATPPVADSAAAARSRRTERIISGALVGACSVALAAWWFARSDAVAIALAVSVELAGVVLTARKVYRRPGTEPAVSWLVLALAGLLDLGAVGNGAGILYAYPASLILMGLGVPAASLLGAHVVLGGRVYARELVTSAGAAIALGAVALSAGAIYGVATGGAPAVQPATEFAGTVAPKPALVASSRASLDLARRHTRRPAAGPALPVLPVPGGRPSPSLVSPSPDHTPKPKPKPNPRPTSPYPSSPGRTRTPSPTPIPAHSPSPTATPTPTGAPTPTPTPTPYPTPTPTPYPSATPTSTYPTPTPTYGG